MALRLRLDSAIDQAQQATRRFSLPDRKRRELEPEIASGNALAVAKVEFPRRVRIVKELLEKSRDRPVPQAIGIVPVERGAGRQLDGVAEALVVGEDFQPIRGLADDGSRNRQGAEQRRVVSRRKMRRNMGFFPLPDGFSTRQTVDGGLHGIAFTLPRLIPGCRHRGN